MGSIITENQSAFVEGGQIDVVDQEVFHHLKLKKSGKECDVAVKVDMSKTYDRVEWDPCSPFLNWFLS